MCIRQLFFIACEEPDTNRIRASTPDVHTGTLKRSAIKNANNDLRSSARNERRTSCFRL